MQQKFVSPSLGLISSASPSVSKHCFEISVPANTAGIFLSVAWRSKLLAFRIATTQQLGNTLRSISMYKAVISDLDGTLLNSQHQVSERTRATLKTLVDGGVKFIVATGRHIIDVQGIRQTMGFECDLIT